MLNIFHSKAEVDVGDGDYVQEQVMEKEEREAELELGHEVTGKYVEDIDSPDEVCYFTL